MWCVLVVTVSAYRNWIVCVCVRCSALGDVRNVIWGGQRVHTTHKRSQAHRRKQATHTHATARDIERTGEAEGKRAREREHQEFRMELQMLLT